MATGSKFEKSENDFINYINPSEEDARTTDKYVNQHQHIHVLIELCNSNNKHHW